MKLAFIFVVALSFVVVDAQLDMLATMRFLKKLKNNNKESTPRVQNRYASGTYVAPPSPPPKSSYEQGLEIGMKFAETTAKVTDRVAAIEVEAEQLAHEADRALAEAEVRAAEVAMDLEEKIVAAAPVVESQLRNAEIQLNHAAQRGAMEWDRRMRNAEYLWHNSMQRANQVYEQNLHRMAQLEQQSYAINNRFAQVSDRFWRGVEQEAYQVVNEADDLWSGIAAGMDSYNSHPVVHHVPGYTVAPHRGNGYWG